MKEKYIIVQKALAAFEEGIRTFHESNALPFDIKRDSLLKRFTLAADAFWRYIEAYLQEDPDADYQMYGPNKILLACSDNSIAPDEQYLLFVSMIQDRLLEPLRLDEELMQAVSNRVPEYYSAMKAVLERIGNERKNAKK